MKNDTSYPDVNQVEIPDWLALDNWKTLFRASFPKPVREFQIICGYKNADSHLSVPDPEFMRVCLTTCSNRVRNALRFEGRIVEEDPGEYLRLVAEKLGFRAPAGAERALAELVEIEKSGLSKFVDVPLKRFKRSGIKLALASNVWPFPMPMIFDSEQGGLSLQDFDQLVLSYEVGYAKPSGLFYQELLRRCQTQASRCLMVGDNPVLDIQAARAEGLNTVQIDHYGDCASGRVARVEGVPLIRKLGELPFAQVRMTEAAA